VSFHGHDLLFDKKYLEKHQPVYLGKLTNALEENEAHPP